MTSYLFGASGALGSAIQAELVAGGEKVVAFSRNPTHQDVIDSKAIANSHHLTESPADSVIWASGANLNDSITDYSRDNLNSLIEANVLYITDTLSDLLELNVIKSNANLVVVSSIWQENAKQNKLSYSISKSALKGLVNSLVADLSPLGMTINAVLPGVVDTPMTRAALSDEQINSVSRDTPARKLVTPEGVAKSVAFLASKASKDVNGQFLVVDGGWTAVRYV